MSKKEERSSTQSSSSRKEKSSHRQNSKGATNINNLSNSNIDSSKIRPPQSKQLIGFSKLYINANSNKLNIGTIGPLTNNSGERIKSDALIKKMHRNKDYSLNASRHTSEGSGYFKSIQTTLEPISIEETTPRTQHLIEVEYNLHVDTNNLIDQLGNCTVKYNETIINKINSNAELKALKDARNKLISKKAEIEKQVELEKVNF